MKDPSIRHAVWLLLLNASLFGLDIALGFPANEHEFFTLSAGAMLILTLWAALQVDLARRERKRRIAFEAMRVAFEAWHEESMAWMRAYINGETTGPPPPPPEIRS